MAEHSLAGLVSAEADELYRRLSAAGSLRMGDGPGQIDMDSPAARELAQADLLYADPSSGDRAQAVAPSTALTLLLSRRQQELIDTHQRVIHGWTALEELLKADQQSKREQVIGGDQTIEVLHDRTAILALSADLYLSAQQDMSATLTGVPLGAHQVLTPPKSSLFGGARFRTLYDGAYASSPAGAKIIEQSRQGGEEARVRAELPSKMVLVDRRIAMIALADPVGGTPDTGVRSAVVVRSPQLLTMLYEWFNQIWDDPATARTGTAQGSPLSQSQRRVLRLLAAGLSDDAIARRSEMSVRTVRRHITSIMEILGTSTRFATGVAASKRGWI